MKTQKRIILLWLIYALGFGSGIALANIPDQKPDNALVVGGFVALVIFNFFALFGGAIVALCCASEIFYRGWKNEIQ